MNILFVSRSIPMHNYGGMEIVAWDLAKALKRQGNNVRFLTTNIPNEPEVITTENIEIHAIANTKHGKYSRSWWKNSLIYFKKNLEKDTDIVLSISAGAYGLLDNTNRRTELPYVLQAHGTSYGEAISKLREKSFKSLAKALLITFGLQRDFKYYALFNAFVTVGQAVYQDALKFPLNKILNKNQIYLINNGIDIDLFSFDKDMRYKLRKQYNIEDNQKVIISASRLHKQKGVHLGLLGFAEYLKTNQNSTYIIIGDGPEYHNLKKLSSKLGIEKKVIFTGALSRENLAKYLSMGDIFLFTTLHNEVGLSLNILEALSSGLKIVISSHIEGLTQIDQNAVISVDPKSPKFIALALENTIEKDRKSYLPKEYSLEYCANEYLKLFKNLRNNCEQ